MTTTKKETTSKKQTTKRKESIKTKTWKATEYYLKNKGYEVVKRKFKFKKQELMVAVIDDILVFVEIGYSKGPNGGMPGDHISDEHRAELEAAGAAYLCESNYVDMRMRFDKIHCLILSEEPDGKAMLRHHINALGIAA